MVVDLNDAIRLVKEYNDHVGHTRYWYKEWRGIRQKSGARLVQAPLIENVKPPSNDLLEWLGLRP